MSRCTMSECVTDEIAAEVIKRGACLIVFGPLQTGDGKLYYPLPNDMEEHSPEAIAILKEILKYLKETVALLERNHQPTCTQCGWYGERFHERFCPICGIELPENLSEI